MRFLIDAHVFKLGIFSFFPQSIVTSKTHHQKQKKKNVQLFYKHQNWMLMNYSFIVGI